MSSGILNGLILLFAVALGTQIGKPICRAAFGKAKTKRWEKEKRYRNKTTTMGWGILLTIIGIGGTIRDKTDRLMPLVVIGIIVALISFKQVKEMLE